MKYRTAVTRILAMGLLMAIAGHAAAQQAYPSKPIRLLVPFPPGGTINALARMIGPKLTESWGQPVLVDNRPGGNTVIASEALVKSAPDGYTLLLTSAGHATNPLLLPSLPYDTIKDFARVTTVSSSELFLLVHPSLPASNLPQFIALAKARPGELNYASAGSGSSTHLAAEFFNMLAGVKIQHIPYKGSAPGITDLIGGQTQLTFSPPILAIPHVKSGRLKALAVGGERRLSALPQVPTFTEGGLPGFDVRSWSGMLAPAGTPNDIIQKLSTEIARILAMPDIKEKLDAQGFSPFPSTPDEFTALIKSDMVNYGKVIKAANIKLN